MGATTYNKLGRDKSPIITEGAKLRLVLRVCKAAGVMHADGFVGWKWHMLQ